MKLYYSPGACSLAPHIVLFEIGATFTRERVDLRNHRTADGADLASVHGKNYVPILVLENGQRLTEGPVILQYLADLKPECGLIPADGFARYRVQEWLGFVASEIHKAFIPLLMADRTSADWREWSMRSLATRFDWISTELWERTWAAGERFSVADAYLFTVVRWSAHIGLDLSPWPVLQDYLQRVAERPAVIAAMKAEGLIQAAAA